MQSTAQHSRQAPTAIAMQLLCRASLRARAEREMSCASPRLLLHGLPDDGGFEFGGAEFEFRDFSEGVELRGGQHVGGRLGVAEWDDDLAWRDRAVAARLLLDGA